MFVAAISLSCIAAFYSIAGLMAIFAAAVVPIIVMGGILEVSKLVVASWLYRSWNDIPRTFKIYFTSAVVILMLLTSMGIFGFLSKAHLDQAVPAGDVSAQVSIFDDKIKTQRDNIEADRKALAQMDAQVDQKLSRSTDEQGADKAAQIRRSQANERKRLQDDITKSQNIIVKLQEERSPIASKARKIEAEVGPIKYIAALIYGDTLDQNMLEKAVRWVIILIVLVFDPLAVLMLVAVNWSLKKSQPKVEEPEDLEPWLNYPINTDPEEGHHQDSPPVEWTIGDPPDWNEDRIDTISQNGNDGIHYDDIIPTPPPPPPTQPSTGININEYISPAAEDWDPAKHPADHIPDHNSIETEIDRLNRKP